MNDQQLLQMRPTCVIGAGGTGQQILTALKAALIQRHGPKAWQQRIRLLALDTAEEAYTVQTPAGPVSLEPGSEFIHIGNVPVPNIMRNIDGLDAIRERMGAIMAGLPPVVLRSGAKQLRPFGLLSLLWNYRTVIEELQQAIWQLAGRERQDTGLIQQQQGINVFICGSLVGGTGSGTFLDLAYIVRALFNELGTQAEFCHLTGVGVLPQAFHGVSGPNLYPNTAAALRELNYLTTRSGFRTRYPDGRLIDSQEAPFNLFYVIDGVDERGQTWPGITAVCTMAAQGLYLQMGSQLGRKGENAFDNLDEVLVGQTPDGFGTFLGSFGLAYITFEAPAVARLCTWLLIQELLQDGWLRPAETAAVADAAAALAKPLDGATLAEALRHDPQLDLDMRVDLSLPDWLGRKRPDEVAAEAGNYVREYDHARLSETYIPRVQQNAREMVGRRQAALAAWLRDVLLDPGQSVAQTLAILDQLAAQLEIWLAAGRRSLAEQEQLAGRRQEAVTNLETAVSRAAASFFVGRSGRIQTALTRYFQAAAELFATRLAQQVAQSQLHVWGALLQSVQERREAVAQLRERLQRLAARLKQEVPARMEALAGGDIASISLADADLVAACYQRHRPVWQDCIAQIGDPLPLCAATTDELAERLSAALGGNFEAVAAMTVQQVLDQQQATMSPRARRQQLFQMATPSWNVDRSRLPDGGAGLVRLEVLGVTDAGQTLFADEPMLVSTHDPHRLTALVVVAGAPQTALQQYDLYTRLLEQNHSRRPVHVIPQFLAGADQARLAFALGSIFDFIYSQGTFFYYRSADPLQPPQKLANGLSNAIDAFAAADELAAATMERVEKRVAQLGLRETIDILTEYYSTVPNSSTSLDSQLRELKRLVRNYTDDLRRIDEFHAGVRLPGGRQGVA